MAKEKIKEVEKPRIPEKIREQYKPRKEGKSVFDKFMKKVQDSPRFQQVATQKGQHHETRVARHQGHGERGKDRQSDEKEQERGKQKAKEERTSGAKSEQRVMGKGKSKGGTDQGGGGKGSQGRGGFGRPMQKKAMLQLKKGAFSKAAQAAAKADSKFADQMKAQMKMTHLSREFLQRIVNQIVKFVKSGLNKDGDHEVRLDLHERIFRGLRLRVALKRGKVSVHFNTSNTEVRELFEGSSENIQKELEAKGIDVGEIKVT